MSDSLMSLVHQVISSPWVYLVLCGLAALDGFFPVIPGETALITVAVFAATGDASVFATIVAGTAGAFIGDHVSYLIGRGAIGRLDERIRKRPRQRAAFDWARATLAARGSQVLLASRYVPGVRTATTITMGGVRFPLRKFSVADLLAALIWSVGWSMLGYLGGSAFGKDPLKGLLFGLGLAAVMLLLSEVVRRFWRARKRNGASDDAPGEDELSAPEQVEGSSSPDPRTE